MIPVAFLLLAIATNYPTAQLQVRGIPTGETRHLAFGLAHGRYEIKRDGVPLDTLETTPAGVIQFRCTGGHDFRISR